MKLENWSYDIPPVCIATNTGTTTNQVILKWKER
jgi:hypothetical protein